VKKKNQQLNSSGGKVPSSRNQPLYQAPAGSMVFYQSKGARSISADGSYAPFVTNPAPPSIFLTNQSAIQTRNPALGESQYTQQSGPTSFSAGPLIHPVYHPQFAKAPMPQQYARTPVIHMEGSPYPADGFYSYGSPQYAKAPIYPTPVLYLTHQPGMQPLIKEEAPPAHQFINIQSQPVVNNAPYAASNGFKAPETKVGF